MVVMPSIWMREKGSWKISIPIMVAIIGSIVVNMAALEATRTAVAAVLLFPHKERRG